MDKSYLTYPKRGYGQDHEFYKWRLSTERKNIQWKDGTKVAVSLIIPLEFFPLNPSGVPFKHPGAMVTPYPDLRHFTVRDYGNRVGVFRILEALENADVKASFAVNGEVARRYPPLIDAIKNAGHEIIAHGLSTDHIHHEGLSASEEKALITETLSCFHSAPKGWLSPARNQSSRTLGLLRGAGLDYCLDWEMDQLPVAITTDVTLIPNSYELSDFTLLHTRRQTEESWLKQIQDAIELLVSEHTRFGGQMLGLTLTPYVIGQPFRIWALRALLAHVKDNPEVNTLTAGEINQQFVSQNANPS
ncbi:polysaccharide deacetylase family protein [Fretibacter rubidus]|uniref:polysaccharide deacetylase family protein n=1 Tax=Fretibacter rubidus TaxID=570162 RepID=UPI00352B7FFF